MVSSEPSLLDHTHILFKLVEQKEEKVIYSNLQITCWASYREELQDRLQGLLGHVGTVKDTEIAVELLQQAIVSSNKSNCR
jgi:hypothetical protein